MSGLDGSSIKQKSQCAAGLPGRSHLSECRSEACVERWVHDIFHLFIIVPVAQPDRVSDSDSEGQGFESLRVRHEKRVFCLSDKRLFFRTQCALRHVK